LPHNQDSDSKHLSGGAEQSVSHSQSDTEPPVIRIDPAHVPPELHPLIPYVEKWGINDLDRQRKILQEAPLSEIEHLCVILYTAWDAVNKFTVLSSSDELENPEKKTFDAFRAVFHEAFSILGDKKPKRMLEIIGWPESYPGPKLNSAIVPPELHPLIPFVEKWVISDEGVRWTALKATTHAELEELVVAVNQIGNHIVRELSFKMLDDETQQEAGYVFALLMELVDEAELLLRQRHA
jgi:hypothetical protein